MKERSCRSANGRKTGVAASHDVMAAAAQSQAKSNHRMDVAGAAESDDENPHGFKIAGALRESRLVLAR